MASEGSQYASIEMLIKLRTEDPEFTHAVSTRAFCAGQAVAEPDVLVRNMLILIKGRVHLLCEGPNGRQLAVATLNPGAVIWEDAWLEGHSPTLRAKALTDCVVWMAPSPQAKQLFLRHAALRWGMLRSASERLTQVERRMEEVAFERLPRRLAWLLLDLACGGRFITATSHTALADMLGTYRETVSAILRGFKTAGFVALGYRTIELCDASGLRAAADSTSYGQTPRLQ